MKLNIRRLTSEDYSTLVKWWDAWPEWQAPPQTFLPDTGFIVEKNNIGIVAGYVYITNSKAALLEWIISNPEYRESDRKDAITLLIQAVERVLTDQGIKHVFTIGRNKHLINLHKKLGWMVDEKPSYEIIKNL
jgi:hypothetical protein|tara:strand:+ start:1223 stop:1621 length:399 start_codon:yes stop_codon:yes gene_type:complete